MLENIMFSVIIVIFALFFDLKGIPALKTREKIAYLSVVCAAFLIILLFSVDVVIPSLSEIVTAVIELFIKK